MECHHEEYVEGCEGCFDEAMLGAEPELRGLMPGADVTRMPSAPLQGVFSVAWRGDLVFTVLYGTKGVAWEFPDGARDRYMAVLDAEYALFNAAHERLERAQQQERLTPENRREEHEALVAKNRVSARLTKLEAWKVEVDP